MLETLFALALPLLVYAAIATVTVRALARMGVSLRRGTSMRPPPRALILAALSNLAIGLVMLALGGAPVGRALGLDARDVAVALALTALTFGLASVTARLQGARLRLRHLSRGLLALTVFTLLCAAWMEEVVFRAYLLEVLAPLGVIGAVLLSSLLFTLVHVPTSETNRHRVVGWALGGVSLSVVYLASGSVWVATAAHLARNLANVLILEPSPELGLVAWERPITPSARTGYLLAFSLGVALATWVAYL